LIGVQQPNPPGTVVGPGEEEPMLIHWYWDYSEKSGQHNHEMEAASPEQPQDEQRTHLAVDPKPVVHVLKTTPKRPIYFGDMSRSHPEVKAARSSASAVDFSHFPQQSPPNIMEAHFSRRASRPAIDSSALQEVLKKNDMYIPPQGKYSVPEKTGMPPFALSRPTQNDITLPMQHAEPNYKDVPVLSFMEPNIESRTVYLNYSDLNVTTTWTYVGSRSHQQ
jgi:hypothetical protein